MCRMHSTADNVMLTYTAEAQCEVLSLIVSILS